MIQGMERRLLRQQTPLPTYDKDTEPTYDKDTEPTYDKDTEPTYDKDTEALLFVTLSCTEEREPANQ